MRRSTEGVAMSTANGPTSPAEESDNRADMSGPPLFDFGEESGAMEGVYEINQPLSGPTPRDAGRRHLRASTAEAYSLMRKWNLGNFGKAG